MKLFKSRKKNKAASSIEKKSAFGFNDILLGYQFSNKMQWGELSNLRAWQYYMQVSVIYNAIDIIAQSFAVISPRIFDKAENRFLTEKDSSLDVYRLLDLLEMPKFGVSYIEFAKQMVANYSATGDLFITASAINDTAPPTELDIINSQHVMVENEDSQGYANKYRVYCNAMSVVYSKDEKNGRLYDELRMHGLWHTKIFNPIDKNKGLSPLNALYYEIEQLIAAAVHNGNLLKRGARPSGALMINPEAELTDENKGLLRQEIKNFYSGSENAGNVLVLENGKEFKELSMTNKDMDFANLKKTDIEQAYRNLKIPLAFVLSETMTLDNFKEAVVILYNMGVLPVADIIFNELDLFLMHRYDDTGRYKLKYNEKDIAALKPQFLNMIDGIIKTGMLTINEGRSLLDLMPLEGETGNSILRPSTLIPIGLVEQQKMTKEKYEKLLRDNNFSEKQIAEYLSKFYGNSSK